MVGRFVVFMQDTKNSNINMWPCIFLKTCWSHLSPLKTLCTVRSLKSHFMSSDHWKKKKSQINALDVTIRLPNTCLHRGFVSDRLTGLFKEPGRASRVKFTNFFLIQTQSCIILQCDAAACSFFLLRSGSLYSTAFSLRLIVFSPPAGSSKCHSCFGE